MVREGCKQTEVGIIPEDWEVSLLVNLAEIRSGIAKNSNNSVKNPISVYYLRVANVQNGFLDLSEMSQLQVSHEDVKRYAVLPGDMLMNEGGDLDKLGRGTLWSGEFSPCIHQNHVFVVRCGSKLLPIYLNCWTGTRAARRYFMTAGKQTTNLASINKTSLGQLPVAHPSDSSEQRSIAQALSDVDALIAALDKAIDKKRAIKTATMQQLLTGKKRLPGFGEGKGDRQTEVGLIPEDWNVALLGELTSELGDGIHATPIYSNNGEYYFVNGNNLFNGKITISSDTRRANILEFKKYKKNLSRRSILMSINGTIGNLAYYQDETIILGKSAAYLNIKKEFSKRYIYFSLQAESVERFFEDGLTGTTIRNLGLGTIRNTPIPVPRQYEEQRAIAIVLSDMDAEIAALETRLAKTQSIKQGMMQELLTGRTRLV